MREVCREISAYLKQYHYEVPALSCRNKQFPDDFAARLTFLKVFRDVLAGNRTQPKDMLWRFFSAVRLTPESHVMDLLEEEEDIFEIYDMNGDQIYRSVNYFDVVSMSVEDLMNMNWKRDFKRNAKITLDLVELILRFATGYFRETFDCAKIPLHIVEEQFARHNRIELALKYISPLKRDGKCVALLASSRAKVIGQDP